MALTIRTKAQLMRCSKAQLVDLIIEQRKQWSDSESGTPVYDSLAHLDPREAKSKGGARP